MTGGRESREQLANPNSLPLEWPLKWRLCGTLTEITDDISNHTTDNIK